MGEKKDIGRWKCTYGMVRGNMKMLTCFESNILFRFGIIWKMYNVSSKLGQLKIVNYFFKKLL